MGWFSRQKNLQAALYYRNVKCRFVQMHTDPAVWRLCAEDDQANTLALMMIYVDDVMFLGNEEAIQVMYDWLTKGSGEEEGSAQGLSMLGTNQFAILAWRSDPDGCKARFSIISARLVTSLT